MTKKTSKKSLAQRKTKVDSATLIRQLQDKLLALGDAVDTIPAPEIEKTAKAISTLIASVEKVDSYLQARGVDDFGGGLPEPSRLDLLRKIKRMVENGALDEVADEDHV